jgi:hypothetical protein
MFDKTIRLMLELATVRISHIYRQLIGSLPPSKFVAPLEEKKPGLWKLLLHRFSSWNVDETRERQERERAEYEAARKQMKREAEERRNREIPVSAPPTTSAESSLSSPSVSKRKSKSRESSKSPREKSSSQSLPTSSAPSTSASPKRGFKGQVKITVESARGLRAVDVGGTSDPFCKILLQGETYETHVVPKNLNPIWDWSFTTFVDSPNEAPVELFRIEVWDKDPIGKNFLGLAYREIDMSVPAIVGIPLSGRPHSKDNADKMVTGSVVLRIQPLSG